MTAPYRVRPDREALISRLEAIVGRGAVATLALQENSDLPEASPSSEEELVELVRMARAEGAVLLPVGSGSKLGWCHPSEGIDFALSTRRLAGILSYEPADGTLCALAGTPLTSLEDATREGGHHLSPEVPRMPGSSGATLGGAVASGQSGFDRLRHGPLRGQLLGVRALLSDGRIARSGGQLVKNVTGYDLHRLYCGSQGSLCILLDAALRLSPRREAERVLEFASPSREEALTLAREFLALHLDPLALVVDDLGEEQLPALPDGSARPWYTRLFLSGHPEVLDEQTEAASGVRSPDTIVRDREASELRARCRDWDLARGEWPEIQLSARPTEMPAALTHLETGAREAGLELRLLLHPGVATASVWLAGAQARPLSTSHARELHHHMSAGPGSVQWRCAPADLEGDCDRFGPPSEGLAWMRRLRDAIEPHGLLPRGRCHGRI